MSKVEEARNVLYRREAPHSYEAYVEHAAQLDTYAEAVRKEAIRETKECYEAEWLTRGKLVEEALIQEFGTEALPAIGRVVNTLIKPLLEPEAVREGEAE